MRTVVLFSLVIFFTLSSSFAADRIVTKTIDDGSPGTLRREISDASPGDTIGFDISDIETVNVDLTIDLTIDEGSLTIDGSNSGRGVTISGDATGNGESADDSRVFRVHSGVNVLMRSLTITGGRAEDGDTSTPDSGDHGGAIYNDGGNVTLELCTIVNNSAGDSGLTGGTISSGGNGGAIYNNAGTMTFSQTTFANNRAGNARPEDYGHGGSGGAIYSTGGSLAFEQCTFAYNSAGDGAQETPHYGFGGHGGAIYSSGSSVSINQCTISLNRAGNGALSDGDGGALWNEASPTFTISDSIVAANVVSLGQPSPDGLGPDLNDDTNMTRSGVNLIGDNTLASGLESTVFPGGLPNLDGDFVGTAVARLDPLLGPLADNGGPTSTMLPQPGSPAVDPVGGATSGGPFVTDQRGFDRFFGGIQDIGSLEVGENDLVVIPLDVVLTPQERVRIAAQLAARKTLKKLKKKLKKVKRKGQVAKSKKLKKKIKKVKKQLRTL